LDLACLPAGRDFGFAYMDGHSTSTFFRPAHAEVDLGALEHNYRAIERVAGKGVGIMAMVKAGAYGHGAIPISKKLVECGVTSLGVATVEEGLELRQAGIDAKVVVMGGLMGMGTPASGVMISAGLTPVIHSADVIESLEMVASSMKEKIGIQLKIDTGMTRLGVRLESLGALLDKLKGSPTLKVEGVMTHLAKAEDPEYTSQQLEDFGRAKKMIEEKLGHIPLWHISNSMAIIRGVNSFTPAADIRWVRPGIVLYGGIQPAEGDLKGDIRPVMSLVSKVVLIKSVPQGTMVSYGCTFTTSRRSRLGMIPFGYADGYPYSLSNKAKVLVRGQRVPVVGRVTMDMIMVDLTDLNEIHVGDEAMLLGRQGEDCINAEELANWADTISYEILTGISERVPRIYKDE
jgi:alanine racemase